MIPDDKQLLSLRPILERHAPLSNTSWAMIAPHLRIDTHPSGEHIVRAGEPVNELCFLISGVVRHYYLNALGKEYNKAFFRSGQLASHLPSLIQGAHSPLYIQVVKLSECLSMPYKEFVYLSNHNAGLASFRTHLLEQSLISKEQRITDLLLLSASERYKKFLRERPDLVDSIPNYHIASYLGITDVALSRIRRRLGLTTQTA